MLKFTLFLLLTISRSLSSTPAEKILDCDETIENIFDNPQEEDRVKLIHNIKEYTSVVNSTAQKLGNDTFNQCKELYDRGWANFLFYDLNVIKLDEFKDKFKWHNEELKQFLSLMKTAEDVWTNFKARYEDYIEKAEVTVDAIID